MVRSGDCATGASMIQRAGGTTPKAMRCAVCDAELQDAVSDHSENQPYLGLEFFTYGHYGSAYFDPIDGTRLILNVCDRCAARLESAGQIRRIGNTHE